jgi:hypothetical protein
MRSQNLGKAADNFIVTFFDQRARSAALLACATLLARSSHSAQEMVGQRRRAACSTTRPLGRRVGADGDAAALQQDAALLRWRLPNAALAGAQAGVPGGGGSVSCTAIRRTASGCGRAPRSGSHALTEQEARQKRRNEPGGHPDDRTPRAGAGVAPRGNQPPRSRVAFSWPAVPEKQLDSQLSIVVIGSAHPRMVAMAPACLAAVTPASKASNAARRATSSPARLADSRHTFVGRAIKVGG